MKQRLSILLCAGCLAMLAGCGSSDEFYRLSATETAPARGLSGLSVSVGPVTLPGYIDRSELVFQSGPNKFQLPSHARWIGSLRENISRVLASDLGQDLHSGQVHSALDTGFAPQYRVPIEIRQFHGVSGQDAVLDLSWRIQGASGETLSRHNGVFHEAIVGDGYQALVEAESRLLGQCAQAIATSLRGR